MSKDSNLIKGNVGEHPDRWGALPQELFPGYKPPKKIKSLDDYRFERNGIEYRISYWQNESLDDLVFLVRNIMPINSTLSCISYDLSNYKIKLELFSIDGTGTQIWESGENSKIGESLDDCRRGLKTGVAELIIQKRLKSIIDKLTINKISNF